MAAEGVGPDVGLFYWIGNNGVLRETDQVVCEVRQLEEGIYRACAWSSIMNMFGSPTFWATLEAAMRAAEKRYLECKR